MKTLILDMEKTALLVNDELERLIPLSNGGEARLQEAMRYATLDGGKRLRPFLTLSTASLFHVSPSAALRAAAAVEMVHCYSLVHDDLPSMDNDDWRRGRPSCHKAFGEATAILAGDALLTRAFEILAEPSAHPDPAIRCELVACLAQAAGDRGMVGGQMLDIIAETEPLDMVAVTRLQQMKTGRLISFAVGAGAILGKAPLALRQALERYARDLGLAFQIADDLLDVEGDIQETGKNVHKDAEAGKATFVSLLGVEHAHQQASMLSHQAIEHLDCFDEKADPLRQIARFVIQRRR